MLLEPRQIRGLYGRIAFDIENNTKANFKATPGLLLGLGVWAPDADVYGYVRTRTVAEEDAVKAAVRTWKPDSHLIGHNIKYEMQWLGFDDELLDRFHLFDTMVAEHLLNEEYALGLDACEARRLRQRTKKDILANVLEETGLSIKKIHEWPDHWQMEYCMNDCRVTYEVAQKQVPRLKQEQLLDLFLRSMDFTAVLYRAERRGMLVSKQAADRMMRDIQQMDEAGTHALAHSTGRRLEELPNLNSPPQLSKFIYQDLGLERPQMPTELAGSPKAAQYQTATGTGRALLEQINHPVVNLIMDIKKVRKVKSYLQSYQRLGQWHKELNGWLVHANFNQTGTVTGRLSCSNPNLQQVSAKAVGEKLGGGIFLRHVFHARPGHKIVGIDYKQMEVVGFGVLSREPTMIKIIKQGGDMHEGVAQLIFGSYDPEKRKVVKTLNFGLLYGLGDAGMAEMMGLPIEETKRLRSLYLSRFPRIKPWMEATNKELEHYGYVRYWSKRKRRIRDSKLHYRGVNALVQGGCADILMEAAIRCDEYLRQDGQGHILALVHDEIIFELPEDRLRQMVKRLRRIMAVPDLLGTPFGTDVSIGRVWDEAEF